MNNSKIINSQKASEITGGSKELFCQMLELFIEIAPEQLERVMRSYEKENFNELVAAAHDIKSSASSFGGDLLYESAFKLEQDAKKKLDLQHLSTIIKELDNNIQSTIKMYKDLTREFDFEEVL